MAVAREQHAKIQPHRRTRKKAPEGRVRRTLLLDPGDLKELREYYGAADDTQALRKAIDSILLVVEAERTRALLSATGGLDDVYGRTTGNPPLPVYLGPGDVPEEDKIDHPAG